MSFNIPETCASQLKNSCEDAKQLALDIDEASVKAGFKISKINGDKTYQYFECQRSRKTRKAKDEKVQDKTSVKINCPFKLSYKLNAEKFEFNESASHLIQNHELNYKRLSKQEKQKVQSYMEVREIEASQKLSILKKNSEVYMQGTSGDEDFVMPENQAN